MLVTCRPLAFLFVLASWTPLIGQEWVGYQDGCGGQLLNGGAASYHDGNQWFGYAVPPSYGDAVFDTTYDPQGNGIPSTVHFGDFDVDTQGVGCQDHTVPGSDAEVGGLSIRSGSFNFELDGQELNLRFSAARVAYDSIPASAVFRNGTLNIQGYYGIRVSELGTAELHGVSVNLEETAAVTSGGYLLISDSSVSANVGGRLGAYDAAGEVNAAEIVTKGATVIDLATVQTAGGTLRFEGTSRVFSKYFDVGYFSLLPAAAHVTGQAAILSEWGTIASGADSIATVEVRSSPSDSSPSLAVQKGLDIGGGRTAVNGVQSDGGYGELVVSGDGTVSVGTTLQLLNGGVVNVSEGGRVAIGPQADLSATPASALLVGSGGVLAAEGAILGDVVVEDHGEVQIGPKVLWESERGLRSIGHLNIDGDFVDSVDSMTKLELGGELPGEYDTVEVSGTATLRGWIDVVLVNNFAPSDRSAFTVLRAETVLDEGAIRTATSPGDLEVLIQGNAVVLYSGLAGDFNHDSVVDAADYTVWRDTKGETGEQLQADANQDLVVDALDYALWTATFGNGSVESAGNTYHAPEPAATFLLLGLAGLPRLRYRQTSTSATS